MSLNTSKKSQYHSALAEPIRVRVESGAMTSKFKAEGESGHYYVYLEHDGYKFAYSAENKRCADTLAAHKGDEITIQAEGRGEDAEIKVLNSDGTHEAPAQRTASQPARSKSPDMNKELTKMMNIFYIIEDAVKRESEQSEVNGVPFDASNFGGKCSQTFRELYHEGVFDSVPNDRPIWSSEKKNATGEYEF